MGRRVKRLVLGAVGLAYLVVPYRIYVSDHHCAIPFLLKHGDPSAFPGDPTMAMYRDYSVLAMQVQRPLVALLGIESAFLLLHLLALLGTFAAVAALARRLAPREPWAPPLALLLIVIPKY